MPGAAAQRQQPSSIPPLPPQPPLACQAAVGAHKAAGLFDSLPLRWKDGLVLPSQGDGFQRWQLLLLLLLACRLGWACCRTRRRRPWCTSRRRLLACCGLSGPPCQHAACIAHIGDKHGIAQHPHSHSGAAVLPAGRSALLQRSPVELPEPLCNRRLARFHAGLPAGLLLPLRRCCRRLLLSCGRAATAPSSGGGTRHPCCLGRQACVQHARVQVLGRKLRHVLASMPIKNAKEGHTAAGAGGRRSLELNSGHICARRGHSKARGVAGGARRGWVQILFAWWEACVADCMGGVCTPKQTGIQAGQPSFTHPPWSAGSRCPRYMLPAGRCSATGRDRRPPARRPLARRRCRCCRWEALGWRRSALFCCCLPRLLRPRCPRAAWPAQRQQGRQRQWGRRRWRRWRPRCRSWAAAAHQTGPSHAGMPGCRVQGGQPSGKQARMTGAKAPPSAGAARRGWQPPAVHHRPLLTHCATLTHPAEQCAAGPLSRLEARRSSAEHPSVGRRQFGWLTGSAWYEGNRSGCVLGRQRCGSGEAGRAPTICRCRRLQHPPRSFRQGMMITGRVGDETGQVQTG